MKPKFQADADLNEKIVRAVLRLEPAIDFRTAAVAGLKGVRDEDVLAIAADDGRILVTHDKKTMKTHFGAFIENRVSSGVIVVRRNLALAAVAEDILLIWAATEAHEWENRFVYLPI